MANIVFPMLEGPVRTKNLNLLLFPQMPMGWSLSYWSFHKATSGIHFYGFKFPWIMASMTAFSCSIATFSSKFSTYRISFK